jgi:hypothetical protein
MKKMRTKRVWIYRVVLVIAMISPSFFLFEFGFCCLFQRCYGYEFRVSYHYAYCVGFRNQFTSIAYFHPLDLVQVTES